jgi:uncharacterized protein (TIGR02996 family)
MAERRKRQRTGRGGATAAERAALLAAVTAAPDEDAPRLVFADWLDENGEPDRAEFIRVGVERKQLDRYDPRYAQLRNREVELVKAHEKEWVKADGVTGHRFREFNRGFVERLTFDGCAAFLKEAPAVFERVPLRGAEVLDDAPAPGDDFNDSPLLERLTALHIIRRPSWLALTGGLIRSESSNATMLLPLLGAEALTDELRAAAIGALRGGGLARMLHSPRLANLRELDLSASWFEDNLLEAFRDARSLARLETLDLTDTSFDVQYFAHVVGSPHLANLRRLYLKGADDVPGVGDEGLEMLCASPHMRNLEDLNLGSQPITRAGYETLARWPGLARLRRLVLEWTGDEGDPGFAAGVRALAHSPHWGELRELDLEAALFVPADFEALLSSPNLATLRELRLDPSPAEEPPDCEAIGRMLLECPYLDGLTELDLGGFKPKPATAAKLRARFGARLRGYGMERR